jgi:protein-S-isoprenylcysteine O-methyltransferase Ste14
MRTEGATGNAAQALKSGLAKVSAMSEQAKDHPEVIAKPPFIYVAFLVVGLALDYVWPVAASSAFVRYGLGVALLALGVAILTLVLRQFERASTNHGTDKPATALVTGGLNRFSRNPIYISLSLIYAGIALLANSVWALGLLAPLLIVMQYGVIVREEQYLEMKFGEDYRRYKAAVRRWI